MIIFFVICVSIIAEIQNLYTYHSHNMPVRRKTEYKVNISMADDDIEMDVVNNLTTYDYPGNKYYKKYRKKPRRMSWSKSLSEQYDENIRTTIQLSSPVTTSKPSLVQIEEKEERNDAAQISQEVQEEQLRKILQIWSLVYIVLAVPIWCTIGSCCCCLFCKRFKAQETIRGAKQYCMWNAPGVLRRKSGDVFYEPTEREIEAHEELEHLMRTL